MKPATAELRLPVRCSACGAPMRLRVTPLMKSIIEAADDAVEIHPDDLLETYQCSARFPDGRVCNTFVEVTAQHLRKATS